MKKAKEEIIRMTIGFAAAVSMAAAVEGASVLAAAHGTTTAAVSEMTSPVATTKAAIDKTTSTADTMEKNADGTTASGDTTTAAGKNYEEITPQDVLNANQLETILQKYGAVTVTNTNYVDGTAEYVTTMYFYMNEEGTPQMLYRSVCLTRDEPDRYISAVAVNGNPTAFYTANDGEDDGLYIESVDQGYLSEQFAEYYYRPECRRTPSGNSLQDGVLLVGLRETSASCDNDFIYYCDPDTLELIEIDDILRYNEAARQTISDPDWTNTYTYSYGVNPELAQTKNAADRVLTKEDACHLTIVYNPGTAEEEVQTFDIRKGTGVRAPWHDGYTRYADRECTEKIDGQIDTNMDAVTIYMAMSK